MSRMIDESTASEIGTSQLLVVDDSGFIGDAMRSLLQLVPEIGAMHTASTAEEAHSVLRQLESAIVLLDLRIRRRSGDERADASHGLALLHELHASNPNVAVVMFTSAPEQQWLRTVAQEGAVGFLSKDGSSDQIIDVLRAVHHGRLGFTAEQLAELGGDAPHRTLLSDRQVEVLRLLDKGLTNQQIAAHLGIQYRTACKHVEHVLKAVGATNRRVAVNEARKLGLL
ncbi:MAG: response regulator transcription factor [Chloroflexi bacterium]|nr:response regulator transcription factor [Chloroflexota bacterium]